MTKRVILLIGLMLCTIIMTAEDNKQEITVKLTVPDAAWTIFIDEVYRVKNELWVISTVQRSPMMAAQVISTVSDSVKVYAPGLPVKHFIFGKTWGWKNEEPYTFLKSKKEIEAQLKTAFLIYKRPKQDTSKQ